MRRRGLALALLCLLPLLAACSDKSPTFTVIPGTEDCNTQIYREDVLVAEVMINPVTLLSNEKLAQPVQEQLALLWQQRLEEQTTKAEQVLADREFNGGLPPWQVCYTVDESPTNLYADNQVVSMPIEGSEYTLGEAHTFNYSYAYNLDAVTGQQLSLEDVWGVGARERVVTEIYAQIESAGRLDDFYPGLKENLLYAINDNSWYMDDKNIHIIYNPYDIGPYALGVVEFSLPR